MTPYSTCTEDELIAIRDFLIARATGQVFSSTNVPGLIATLKLDSMEDMERQLLLIGDELYRTNPRRYKRARRIKLTVMRAAFDDRVNSIEGQAGYDGFDNGNPCQQTPVPFSISGVAVSAVVVVPNITPTGLLTIMQLAPTGNISPATGITQVPVYGSVTVGVASAPGAGNSFNFTYVVFRYS